MRIRIEGRDGSELLNASEASAFLGTTERTLNFWRARNRGPEFVKLEDGWSVRYRVSDVEKWLETKPWARPTAQVAA